MSLPEVAKYLDVSERTLRIWSQKGEIPAIKLGTAWKYRLDEIEDFLDKKSNRRSLGNARNSDWDEKQELENKISLCEEYIVENINSTGNNILPIMGLEFQFDEDILEQAIKKLVKSKKFQVKDVVGRNNKKVKAIVKK